MNINRIAFAACVALAGCSGGSTSLSQGAYALVAALDTAEKLALAAETAPGANPAMVAELKALDAQAYAAIAPLAANTSSVTADELLAAQAAMAAFSQYLMLHQGK